MSAGEWTGKVLRAVKILDPDEAEARRRDLTERKQALEDGILDTLAFIELWDPPILPHGEYEETLRRLRALIAVLRAELADVVPQLKRIVDAPERLVVYSHPDALKFGWWRTFPEDPEDARFDTFISGNDKGALKHRCARWGYGNLRRPCRRPSM